MCECVRSCVHVWVRRRSVSNWIRYRWKIKGMNVHCQGLRTSTTYFSQKLYFIYYSHRQINRISLATVLPPLAANKHQVFLQCLPLLPVDDTTYPIVFSLDERWQHHVHQLEKIFDFVTPTFRLVRRSCLWVIVTYRLLQFRLRVFETHISIAKAAVKMPIMVGGVSEQVKDADDTAREICEKVRNLRKHTKVTRVSYARWAYVRIAGPSGGWISCRQDLCRVHTPQIQDATSERRQLLHQGMYILTLHFGYRWISFRAWLHICARFAR